MSTSCSPPWSLGRKHEMGQAFFMNDLLDEVRRQMNARLNLVARRRGFSRGEQLAFAREVVFEVASNLVNEMEEELRRLEVDFGPSLFPGQPK